MNNEEARFILRAYRPSGEDATDAAFSAALEQAKNDPELQRWLTKEVEFDRGVSRKLGEIAPPVGLRAAILAGSKVSGLKKESGSSGRWWKVSLGLAAAAAVLAGGFSLAWPKRADARELLSLALHDLNGREHDGHGAINDALQAQLGAPAWSLRDGLPVDIQKDAANGCRVISFHGREILEVCFKRNGVWMHCYVARRSDFKSLREGDGPLFQEMGKSAAVAWQDSKFIYAVASPAGLEALKSLL